MLAIDMNQESSALSSVVAKWTFNNGNSAIVKDQSGNGNDGIIIGSTVLSGKNCKTGHCLSFDGVDDLVSVKDSTTLNFGSTGSFSISLWMKSSNGEGWIVDHRRNNDGIYAGYTIQDASGIIAARIRDSSGNDVPVISTTNIHDGKFHQIIFVVDRSTQTEKLYIDKNLEASANISTVGNIDTAFDLHLGGTAEPNTPVDFYTGILDQVTIYDQALSQSMIRTL